MSVSLTLAGKRGTGKDAYATWIVTGLLSILAKVIHFLMTTDRMNPVQQICGS